MLRHISRSFAVRRFLYEVAAQNLPAPPRTNFCYTSGFATVELLGGGNLYIICLDFYADLCTLAAYQAGIDSRDSRGFYARPFSSPWNLQYVYRLPLEHRLVRITCTVQGTIKIVHRTAV